MCKANDKRAGNRFGYSIAVDDDVGSIVVGAVEQVRSPSCFARRLSVVELRLYPLYLQSLTRPDFDQPGSVANVQLGVFGSMYSMRADGGINSGQVGYASSVWTGNVNPWLRNVANSRGGYAGAMYTDYDVM